MGRPKNIGVHSTGYSLPRGTFSTVKYHDVKKNTWNSSRWYRITKRFCNYNGENRHRWFEADSRDSRSLINYVVDRQKIWYTFLHTCFVCWDREAVRVH